MEINVGEYVRTKKSGYIGKIYNINEFREPNTIYALDIPRADDYVFMGKDDFISSKDIIDLIEVGDYVNGHKVIDIRIDEKLEIGVESDNLIYQYIQNKDIKSILTHEQFESNAYKIEKER